MHKTCEDSHDKGVQFVLEAAPQHQTSNDYVPKGVEEWKILIQTLMFLRLRETWGEKDTFMYICALACQF